MLRALVCQKKISNRVNISVEVTSLFYYARTLPLPV